ncbi:DUF2157 domain-containing protein [Thioflexithrix psekupsensis]|uniref:DUF2157 domain-containing protein n=1 Tax=Thioflexithrix psekupsensis TaxID=1570016 RepID=UPI000A3609B3|nr:DUF2157 domain-containing protein [Thioflexithrix psekupsensis]
MRIRLSRQDFDWAVQQGLIQAEQAKLLWEAFQTRQPERSRFDFVNLAYYSGALLIIVAMAWLMTETWTSLGSTGLLGVALIYAFIFASLGYYFWFSQQLKVAGGLLFTLMVIMTPLVLYALFLIYYPELQDAHFYRAMRENSLDLWMTLGTIAVATVTLLFVRFPFLVAPIAFCLWYIMIQIIPDFLGKVEFSWGETQSISLFFGLLMILVAYLIDQRTKEDFAFWLYLFGTLGFWVSLTLMSSDSELEYFAYFMLNVILVIISVLLQRRIFIIFGAIGIFIYLGHLAYDLFEDLLFFPITLSAIGLLIIIMGVQYQRYRQHIEQLILASVPQSLRPLLPSERKEN